MSPIIHAMVYITYLGTASFVIEGDGTRLLTDPGDFLTARFQAGKAEGLTSIDMVIVTHADFDHTNRLSFIPGVNAMPVVGTASVRDAFPTLRVITEDSYGGDGIEVRRIKSIHGFRHDVDHSSYLIRIAGLTLLFMGDAYRLVGEITEHVDIMFVTIGGFEATPANAVRLVSEIKPDTVIPMHWELFARTDEPAIRFRGLLEKTGMKVRCIIPIIDETITVTKANELIDLMK